MKTLIVLILCHVLVLQGRTSEDCKFWPYWNSCDTKQSLSRETGCCIVLERIFGGECPEFCTTDSCIDAPQKISTWCGLTQNNTNKGMSCETGVRRDNGDSRKNETKIFHSCCESLDCKDETEKQCSGDYGENIVTIYLRKTCCSEGYSGWTCSGDFIRDRRHTTKSTTSKPSTKKPTTSKPSTKKPTTSKPSTKKPTTSKPSTTRSTEEAATRELSTEHVQNPDQSSEDLNIAISVASTGGVVVGLLGGVIVVLIWSSCRRRRQIHKVEREPMPITPRPVVSDLQTPRPVVSDLQTPQPVDSDQMPPTDDEYISPVRSHYDYCLVDF